MPHPNMAIVIHFLRTRNWCISDQTWLAPTHVLRVLPSCSPLDVQKFGNVAGHGLPEESHVKVFAIGHTLRGVQIRVDALGQLCPIAGLVSLTVFHSVGFLQTSINVKSEGFLHSHNQGYQLFFDGFLGPPCLAQHAWLCPYFTVVPEGDARGEVEGPRSAVRPCQIKKLGRTKKSDIRKLSEVSGQTCPVGMQTALPTSAVSAEKPGGFWRAGPEARIKLVLFLLSPFLLAILPRVSERADRLASGSGGH